MVHDYDFLLRVRAPRPAVFERLLRIEHLARWFFGWSRIEPKVGGKFRFGGETLRRFAFTWPIRGHTTRVSYDLEDEGNGATVLRVRHTGLPSMASTCGTL